MSPPRPPTVTFVPRNRLARFLSTMSRRDFDECIDNAEREIERIAPILGESLEGDVQALIRLCRQEEVEVFGQCREIGWLALRIIESARIANRPELADTAKGVWEMIDALSDRGVWHTEALRLHAEALQALIGGTALGEEDLAIMERQLLKMRTAIGVTPQPT